MAQDTSTVSSGASGGQPGFERDRPETTVSGALRAYVDRVRGGDLGALPAVLGIIVLCILFTALRPNVFPTPINFANLLVQAVPITLLAMGLVFVLLLGEIDLSAGVVSGVCAAVLAQSLAVLGAPWYIAVLLALGVGALIGLITGSLVGMVGIPSFVVTLALFLAWQGVTLRLIGQGGTVPIRNPVIVGLTNANLPVALGWLLAVLTVVAYAAEEEDRHRAHAQEPVLSELARARGGRAPHPDEERIHERDDRHLTELDPQVEREHRQQDAPADLDEALLQLGREAEAVHEAKEKRQQPAAGKRLSHRTEVLDRHVDDRRGDQQLREARRDPQDPEPRQEERHAVGDGERGDDQEQLAQAGDREQQRQEKGDVVVAHEDVVDAQPRYSRTSDSVEGVRWSASSASANGPRRTSCRTPP